MRETALRFLKDKKAIALCIGYVSTILGYGIINKLNLPAINLTTQIDSFIPLVKVFVVPYYMWYPLVLFSFIYIYHKDNNEFYKFGWTMIGTMGIALLIFFFFQTTVTRPAIYGNDIFSNLIRGIYVRDMPVNCCPSLHVGITLVCTYYVNKISSDDILCKSVNVIGILIILSTIFIKQHVIVDVIGGFILFYGVKSFVEKNISEENIVY